ncbi:hypothetical protein JKF63_02497 [Porcisia hertigi]|uniref:LicD/FKTN/FKRP nucleotidyltransferase domain-containing protein n=1 Tax=Porcisia hertigi TaxID=2761500 RepID=A0A836IF35_9TRYP|nr:hypothetical protein JKF63_02497 [Porcisia hertigi]
MQRNTHVWKRAAQATFRPHLHQSECRICAAAIGTQKVTPNDDPRVAKSTTFPVKAAASPVTVAPTLHGPSDQSALEVVDGTSLTFFELRRTALLEWLDRFSEPVRKGYASDVKAPVSGEGVEALSGITDLDAAYEAYLRCADVSVQEVLFARLVNSIDGHCQQPTRECVASPTSGSVVAAGSLPLVEGNEWGTIRVPRSLVAFRVGVTPSLTEANATVSHVGVNTASIHATNDFEVYVRQRFAGQAAAITKQLAFQKALLAVREVLRSQNIRFFLACGTALGARRDGCFIPYDEDVDLGIFFTDIAEPVRDTDELPDSGLSALSSFPPTALSAAQMRVYRLLHALASTQTFVVFDICGAVEKGLELRVQHIATGTRIDINLYYPPVTHSASGGNAEASDDALVHENGLFIWAASFYEGADARKHHMYRYRHKPFATELEELPFCAKTASLGDGFLVPPERYLLESYGEDWQVQRQFSYAEGLAGEFKNIMEE